MSREGAGSETDNKSNASRRLSVSLRYSPMSKLDRYNVEESGHLALPNCFSGTKPSTSPNSTGSRERLPEVRSHISAQATPRKDSSKQCVDINLTLETESNENSVLNDHNQCTC